MARKTNIGNKFGEDSACVGRKLEMELGFVVICVKNVTWQYGE